MRAILVGSVETKLKLRDLDISREDFLVAIDGGVDQVFRQGYRPSLAIGDWDSLKNPKLLNGVPTLSLPHEKNESDLAWALAEAVTAGADHIECLGVTGGRPDHQFASIYELAQAASGVYGPVRQVVARGEDADYYFISSVTPVWRARMKPGALVSILPVGGTAFGVTLSGFKYETRDINLLCDSRGLSNQVLKSDVVVEIDRGILVLIVPKNIAPKKSKRAAATKQSDLKEALSLESPASRKKALRGAKSTPRQPRARAKRRARR